MARMLRVVLGGILLMFCVTTVVFWIRSWPLIDTLETSTAAGSFSVTSVDGRIMVEDYLQYGEDPDPPGWGWSASGKAPGNFSRSGDPPWKFLDFEWFPAWGYRRVCVAGLMFTRDEGQCDIEEGVSVRSHDAWSIAVPHWMVVLATGFLPVRWGWRSWASRRSRANKQLCIHCGYDLRATPMRCPECGSVVRPRHRQTVILMP